MNLKADAFGSFLKKNNIKDFQVKELSDDEQNTAVFCTNIVVENQRLPSWVLLNESPFITIRVMILQNALTMDNELKSMYFVNGQNRDFRPFKMYFDGDGALIMELCWAVNGQTQEDFSTLGNEIYRGLDMVIMFLNQNYKKWMKEMQMQ